jgi:thioredoxin-like negative regulator of GroEL
MPATPVDDHNFEARVIDASLDRPVIVAFFTRADPRLTQLETIFIDRAGCFHLAVADPLHAARARVEWALEAAPVWAFRDGWVIRHFDGARLVHLLREWLDAEMPREAERFAREGDASAIAGDPQALELYTTALGCNPDNPRALLGLARIHALRGDWSGALSLATRVPRTDALGMEAERLVEELRTQVDPEGAEAAVRGRRAMNFDDAEAARRIDELDTRRQRKPSSA